MIDALKAKGWNTVCLSIANGELGVYASSSGLHNMAFVCMDATDDAEVVHAALMRRSDEVWEIVWQQLGM
jgi:hypothetical protein